MLRPARLNKGPASVAKTALAGLALLHMVYYYATINRPGVARWEIATGVVAAVGTAFLAEGTIPFYHKVREAQGSYLGVIAGLFNFFAAFAAGAAAAGHTLGALSVDLTQAFQVAFVIGLGGLAVFATAYFIGGGYEDARPTRPPTGGGDDEPGPSAEAAGSSEGTHPDEPGTGG
jgi:hypothetical protein